MASNRSGGREGRSSGHDRRSGGMSGSHNYTGGSNHAVNPPLNPESNKVAPPPVTVREHPHTHAKPNGHGRAPHSPAKGAR